MTGSARSRENTTASQPIATSASNWNQVRKWNHEAALHEAALDFEGGLRRLHGAGELRQKAVANQLEDAAVMARHGRFDKLTPVLPQRVECCLFVRLHQSAKAHDLGRHNGGELAPDTLSRHSPSKNSLSTMCFYVLNCNEFVVRAIH